MAATNRELFKNALGEAMASKYGVEMTECSSESAVCSATHYDELSKIIGVRVKKDRRFSKKSFVAILVAAALLLAGCAVCAYREDVLDFIENVCDKYIVITGNELNSVSTELVPYRLSYMLEGYELESEEIFKIRVWYSWRDADNNTIRFTQNPVAGSSKRFDVENGYTEILNFGGKTIYHRGFEKSYIYVWLDDIYFISLDSSVKLPEEELTKIIEGIVRE